MPRLIITEDAGKGMERCQQFLFDKHPEASRRAGQVIAQHFTLLEANPGIGRPFDDDLDFRELIFSFGESGHVALYRHEKKTMRLSCWPSGTRKKRVTDHRPAGAHRRGVGTALFDWPVDGRASRLPRCREMTMVVTRRLEWAKRTPT